MRKTLIRRSRRCWKPHAQHGPKLDEDVKNRVKALLVKETGVSMEQLEHIEAL